MNRNETSKEEQTIYTIIDEILRTEDKISELTLRISNEDNSNPNVYLNNLSSEKEGNISKIKELQKELENQLLPYNSHKQIKQEQFNELQEKISKITTYMKTLAQSTKGNIYKMSYEKIEEMINNKKNLDDMQMIEQEMTTANKLREKAFRSLTELKNKQNEINESLKMIKEEKEMYKEDVINLISQKESIEEMIKIHFNRPTNKNSNSNKMKDDKEEYSNDENNKRKNIEVFCYEIERGNYNKTSADISEYLLESVKYDNTSGEYDDFSNVSNKNIQKAHIVNTIKNEIIEYLNKGRNNHKTTMNYISTTTEDFINKLSKVLINITQGKPPNKLKTKDKSNGKFPTEESFALYLKCIFKISYYEDSIQYRLSFIDKDYKTNKKAFFKQVNSIQINITKLSTQLDEIDLKINEIKRKKDIIIKNTKSKDIIELSPREREFIQQNEALNILNHERDHLQNELEEIKAQIKDIREQYDHKVALISKENNGIDQQKEKLLKEQEEEQINAKETIVKLRKMIGDKYTIIKTQLKLYREKNGNNLTLYNKLVENINNTIKNSNGNYYDSFTERSFFAPTSRYDTYRSNKGNHNKSFNMPYSSSMHNIKDDKRKYYRHQDNDDNDNEENDENDNYNNCISRNDLNNENNYDYNNRTVQPKTSHRHNKSEIAQSLTGSRVNDQAIAWVKERDKLNQTIKSLKAKISKTKIISDRFSAKQKLKPLNEFILCYYRIYTKNSMKFNPLIDSLPSETLPFVRASVMMDNDYANLLLHPSTDKTMREIPVESIENTIVSMVIKHIVHVYRENRKMKGLGNAIEELMKRKEFAAVPLTKAEKAKAIVNKQFNLSILMKTDERIEFVFLSYEDFKVWINGLSYLIKNKGSMNKYKVLMK